MKIELLMDVPVFKEAGLITGRVLDVLRVSEKGRGSGYWVVGDTHAEVLVLRRECRLIQTEES